MMKRAIEHFASSLRLFTPDHLLPSSAANMTTSYPPAKLLSTFLDCIESQIIPLTAAGVKRGSKVFGAAVLRKSDLGVVVAQTNDERTSPLLHGEVNTIQTFYGMPKGERPSAKDCVFLTTHEPCSLCLRCVFARSDTEEVAHEAYRSAITWAGFDNFTFLFSYQDTRDAFAIPHDLDILHEVFRVPAQGESKEAFDSRPEYNKKNKFFEAKSFAELVEAVEDPEEKEKLAERLEKVKEEYNRLSKSYQASKGREAEIPLA